MIFYLLVNYILYITDESLKEYEPLSLITGRDMISLAMDEPVYVIAVIYKEVAPRDVMLNAEY